MRMNAACVEDSLKPQDSSHTTSQGVSQCSVITSDQAEVKLDSSNCAESLAKTHQQPPSGQLQSAQGDATKKNCSSLPRVKVTHVVLSAVIIVQWAVLTLPITAFYIPTDTLQVLPLGYY